ncbi:uncharacterized protein LOC107414932 [Ziziphus jujuba]|uniref:Uncharacterized protein LOC107414932 n=1 Tax=Ziziphus jujuba TaxID=326968 RepID=A0A6P3ZYM1_ZIZJJ|nr:uncharacterized protein LOC107414932 [Ziziphus jujuba]
MGNCVALCKPTTCSCIPDASITKEGKVLKIVKTDGKILTFRDPVLVKDILVKLTGSGIGLSKEATENLPPDYRLNLGKVYYLLPNSPDSEARSFSNPAGNSSSISSIAGKDNKEGGIRRIKIIIPKQQLQELLAKQISVEEILSGLNHKKSSNPAVLDNTSPSSWKPKLESIPEGSELVNVCS